MTPTTPPGTVPLFYNFSLWQDDRNSMTFPVVAKHLGLHERHEEVNISCGCLTYGCLDAGFRVVDEAAFNAWLEKLKWGSTLVEWEQKRRRDEASY